jgi:hypothetical protein
MNHFPVSLIQELKPVLAFAEWYPLSEISKFVVLAMFVVFSKVLIKCREWSHNEWFEKSK